MKKEIKNLIQTTKDVATGFAKTGTLLNKSPDTRMNICRACACFDGVRCSKAKCKEGCNCLMAVKVKLEFATCPLKKW